MKNAGVYDYMTTTYVGGFVFILIGIIAFIIAKRNPQMSKDAWRGDIYGWVGGTGCTIVGILIIIGKLLGKI
jgi:hypothetical protein